MNLIEAVRSGKDYKRACADTWRRSFDNQVLWPKDILATDWELKPEPREGEGCATCMDLNNTVHEFYVNDCSLLGHTPFKWREIVGGE